MTYNRDALLKRVDALIEESPRMRLADIARSLGVDRHTIENAMLAKRKTTFREHRRKHLMDSVRRLFQQPNLSVKEIGAMLGYSSAASFSRFVREATGKPPSRLREEDTVGQAD